MGVSWSDDLGVTDDPDRFEEAVRAFRKRVPMTDEEWQKLDESERERAFKVSAVANADLVQDVYDAIERAIEDGTDFDDFKAAVGDQLAEAWGGEDAYRLESVFRTNVLGAYNAGRYEVFSSEEARESRPYWRFEAIEDDRIDDECAEADGTVLPADDAWWSRHIPPLHINCRCSYTALSEAEVAEDGGLTSQPPAAEADDGFGRPPRVDDWEPNTDRFDDDIARELERKLG